MKVTIEGRFNQSTLNKLCFEFFYWYICWYPNIWM